jgi:hypothetical protein
MNLPRELLSYVSSFLSLRELAYVSRLNREWEISIRTASAGVHHTYTYDDATLAKPCWTGAVSQNVKSLILAPPTQNGWAMDQTRLSPFFSNLHRHMPRLRSLTIQRYFPIPQVFGVEDLYNLPSGLQELIIRTKLCAAPHGDKDVNALFCAIGRLKQLRTLCISEGTFRSAHCGESFRFSLRPLQNIQALACIVLDISLTNVDDHIQPLLHAPALRRVAVGSMDNACVDAVVRAAVPWIAFAWKNGNALTTHVPRLVASMRDLAELDIIAPSNVLHVLLAKTAPVRTSIVRLSFDAFNSPVDHTATLASLPTIFPNLELLHLYGDLCTDMSAELQVCLRELPRLKSLNLVHMRMLNSLECLNAASTTLTHLVLNDLNLDLTPTAMAHVAAMHWLQHLALYSPLKTNLDPMHVYMFELPTRTRTMPCLKTFQFY